MNYANVVGRETVGAAARPRSRHTVLLVHQFALPRISGLTVTLAELVRLIPEVDGETRASAMSYDRFAHPEQLVATLDRDHQHLGCVVGLNLHIEVASDFTTALASWCARTGTRLFLHVHDYWPHHRDGVAALTERFGARLLAITPAIAVDLAADGFAADLLPAGIAVTSTSPASQRRLPPEPTTVGAVGRLVPRKRFPDIVGAFCEADLGPDASLHLRVPPSLVFPPEQDRRRMDEIHAEVQRCRHPSAVTVDSEPRDGTDYTPWAMYISASEYEGVSMTPLESILQACPFLLSDIPPHQRIVDAIFPGRRPEFLFPVGDRHGLAELIRDEFGTGRRKREAEARREEIHETVARDWSLRATARQLALLARGNSWGPSP